ncbi:MAG TPA: Uma2 family endonuclease [Thermoanaerobaculia bacterium]
MAAETSIKLTYEDYLAIPDDGRRHEIIDGEYYVSPSPSFKHQLIVAQLLRRLGNHVDANVLGWVVGSPLDVLTEHTMVQPDVLYISRERASIVLDTVKGALDLIVEVLSSNREYDEHVKYKIYESAGVLEYWIVDPEAKSVKIFRRTGNKFAPGPVSDVITTPLLPNFQLRIADLFT